MMQNQLLGYFLNIIILIKRVTIIFIKNFWSIMSTYKKNDNGN